MNRTKAKAIVFALGVLFGMVVRANADTWDQKTIFTFSGPVEISGQVLDAGTHVFKLADSGSDRNIVQVFNKNENRLYGHFLTVPDYRLKPAGKTIITFDERPSGSPEAAFVNRFSRRSTVEWRATCICTVGTTQPQASLSSISYL
jgi:hypothetical protein